MRFLVALAALASSVAVLAENFTVIVGKDNLLTYDPPFVTAKEGDVVAFQFVSKNHTVTQSTFANPCQKMTTPSAGVDSGFMPVAAGATAFPQWSITINNASTPLWFYCDQQPHCSKGMVFAINPTAERTYDAFKATATGGASTSATTEATTPTPSNGASPMSRSSIALAASVALSIVAFL